VTVKRACGLSGGRLIKGMTNVAMKVRNLSGSM
jgi:hypothetical protein